MVLPSINILNHASCGHTIEAFFMYKKEFNDGAAYKYQEVQSSTCDRLFEVCGVKIANDSHGEEQYEFKHILSFNNE